MQPALDGSLRGSVAHDSMLFARLARMGRFLAILALRNGWLAVGPNGAMPPAYRSVFRPVSYLFRPPFPILLLASRAARLRGGSPEDVMLYGGKGIEFVALLSARPVWQLHRMRGMSNKGEVSIVRAIKIYCYATIICYTVGYNFVFVGGLLGLFLSGRSSCSVVSALAETAVDASQHRFSPCMGSIVCVYGHLFRAYALGSCQG